jgi:hypothetical protein
MSVALIIQPLPPAELAALEDLHRVDPDEGFLDALDELGERFPDKHLDRAWHAIHFLLTGTADGGPDPECLLLNGGRELVGWELGNPPNRWLSPDEVSRFAACLSGITAETLKRRWNLPAMVAAEVYGADLWDDDGSGLAYVTGWFEQLKTCVAAAARDKHGLLLYLS